MSNGVCDCGIICGDKWKGNNGNFRNGSNGCDNESNNENNGQIDDAVMITIIILIMIIFIYNCDANEMKIIMITGDNND